MAEDNWETGEVINWLINDAGAYSELLGEDAETIEEFVVRDQMAPQGLYDSFKQPPESRFTDVDWESVAESLAE